MQRAILQSSTECVIHTITTHEAILHPAGMTMLQVAVLKTVAAILSSASCESIFMYISAGASIAVLQFVVKAVQP